MNAELVTLSNGTVFPARWTTTAQINGGPWLELTLVAEDGELVIERFAALSDLSTPRYGGNRVSSPLTLADIRALATKPVIDEVVTETARHLEWSEVSERRRLTGSEASASTRHRPITPQLLRTVADLVREEPGRPRQAVSEKLHASLRTASRWIATAKKQGYLDKEKN
jgi:hypothetical protein